MPFKMADWTLPRRSNSGVTGYAFRGAVRELAGVRLKRKVMVLGFNHNIQSSFGVTTKVKASIRNWIERVRTVLRKPLYKAGQAT